jgi:hypothetical protein
VTVKVEVIETSGLPEAIRINVTEYGLVDDGLFMFVIIN